MPKSMQWKANPRLSICGRAEWTKVFPPTHQGEVTGVAPFPSQSSAPRLGAGSLQMAAGKKAMCRDLTPSSPAVVLLSVAPAPI